MRAAWRITAKDLRLRLRDRSAIVVGIVVPLVLAFVFNLVFAGAFGEGALATIGFVNADRGEISHGLVGALDALSDQGIIEVEEVGDAAELRTLVDEGELSAGLVVPEGFSQAVTAGQQATVTVVASVDGPTSASIARGIASAFGTSVADAQRSVEAVLTSTGGIPDPERISQIASAAAEAAPAVTIGPVAAADRVLEPSTFFSASMAVFFLFFLVQFGVTGLIDERRDGTLARLQAAPIPRWSIPVGKALTSFILGMVALTVLATASTLLMGAEWGNPVGLAALFAAVTLAATSLVGIVAGVARTPEGAGNLVAVIAVGMGMLGGSFFPVAGGNDVIEAASLLTPHSWFLRGVGDLQAGGGLSETLPSLSALLVFALVGGVVAAILLNRREA
ncbi:MAG TPA: ABC transporter permease [Acidimicrobiia bacterium]|nr:ABC transporter permease [Acidimicrobiia bacterium]